jgi:hypothetical protein
LPNFFLLYTFSFPLLANNFGNVRIVKAGVASNDVLLVMLPIKNKSYQESTAEQDVRKQRALSFVHFKSYGPIGKDVFRNKEPSDSPFRGRGIFGSG